MRVTYPPVPVSRHKLEHEGWCDLYCELCGDGPFVSLGQHAGHKHGGAAAYRKALGLPSDAPLDSDDYQGTRRALAGDQEFRGFPKGTRCKRGHLLAGRNLVHHKGGTRSPQCRACMYLSRDRKKGPLPTECEWCGGSLEGMRRGTIYCEDRCRALASFARRKVAKSDS